MLGFTLQPAPAGQLWAPTPILEDRLRLAVSLYQRNITKTLILSGGWGSRKNQAQSMRNWLLEQPGAAQNDWNFILEGRSNTTFQNAQFSFDLIKRAQQGQPHHRISSILIVTSSFHQFRSEAIFRKMIREDLQLAHIKVRFDESNRSIEAHFF